MEATTALDPIRHGFATPDRLSLPGSLIDAKGPRATPRHSNRPSVEANVTTPVLRLLPALLTLAAILVTAAAAHVFRDQKREREALLQILEESGLDERSPRLIGLVRSDPDVHAAKERVALALVADLLDPTTRADAATPTELDRRLQLQIGRLDIAEQLAHEVLAQRPTSWRSSTAIGAAIYLRRSLRRDERLLRSYRDWEEPLLRARRIAPGRAEPARFLTMAYLELWPVLSEEKQELTRSMLAPALTDRTTYLATIGAWLQVAGDDLDAIDRLPQTGWLLQDLTARLIERNRLALALESHRRWRAAIAEEAETALLDARASSSRGDHTRAAKLGVQALVQLPTQLQWLAMAEDLLAVIPSGQLKNQGLFTRRWFDFELEQCLRSECRLSEKFVERILPMSSRGTYDRLIAALSLGDWEEMQGSESEVATDARCTPQLEPYWLAKAILAVRENDLATARAAFTECLRPSRGLELAHDRLLDTLRRAAGASSGPLFAVATRPILGAETAGGQEFELPPGEYELTLDFDRSAAAGLSEVLIDGDLVASVALPAAGGVRTVNISASGAAQFLRTRLVVGPLRSVRIVDFKQLEVATTD